MNVAAIPQGFVVGEYIHTNFGVSGVIKEVVQGKERGWRYDLPYYLVQPQTRFHGGRKYKPHWITQAEIHIQSWINK